MIGRERILTTLKHEEPDLIPMCDSVWESTLIRWQNEGFPKSANATDHSGSVSDYFGFEYALIFGDYTPQYTYEIIEETSSYKIIRNGFGEIIKDFTHHDSTPLIISSPVKTKKDWEMLKERYSINASRLVSIKNVFDNSPQSIVSWEETLRQFKYDYDRGRFIFYCANLGYDTLQRYLGSEETLMTMVKDPKWLKDIVVTHAKFVINLYEYLVENGLHFDGAFMFDDMGYKNTSLFSPSCYKEIIFPGDKLICEYFHDAGKPIILHSDGNVKGLIPLIIEAGFDCLEPLEVKAGMDVRELKKEYGDKLSFMGNIDVRLMSDSDHNKIEEEIKSKFKIAKKNGGYIYHSDHTVPNNVSFMQYKKVIELVEKYRKY